MQQATRPIAQVQPTGNIFAPPPASPRFVVNLCSSTTPAALVQPTHAGLKRFTFFVSRRLEEGRERFRLHMGYFESQEEAEKMLDLVRDVYPAAWAGVAPGIKLRARAAQASAAEAAPAAAPVADVPAEAPVLAAVAVVATPAPEASAAVAAAAAGETIAAVTPEATAGNSAAVTTETTAAATAGTTAAAAATTDAAAPSEPAAVAAPVAAVAPPPGLRLALAPDLPRAQPVDDATRSLVDVRAAIDSLADTAPQPTDAMLEGEAVLQLLTSARPAPAARVAPVLPRSVPAPAIPRPAVDAPASEAPAPEAAAPVARAARAATRDDAAARTDAAGRAEPALFAVQLLWSVQPIDMNQVPLLAIFSAYTLYGAEGNRDGRRWYGLRLGFFTDAVSAKQVAQYVRSEFKSVSVVPVSERERGRANKATARPLPQNSRRADAGPELNFIDDVPTDTAASGNQPALTVPPPAALRAANSPAAQAAIAAVGLTAHPTSGKRVKARGGASTGKVQPKRPRQLSLEETLEILGAGDLSLEKSRGELMNDQSRRDRKPTSQGTSKFGRLINRLAERLGNG